MILMLAPAAGMTFGAAPSGAAYVSDQFGLIKITNDSAGDQTFLQGAGCFTLTPFGSWGFLAFDTLANLYAADMAAILPGLTGYPRFVQAVVYADPTSSKNGTWAKSGTGNGVGNWTRVADTISNQVNAAVSLGISTALNAIAAAGHQNPTVLPGTRVSRTSDASITSNTTLAADDTLQVPLSVGQLVTIRGKIFYSTGLTGDFKFRLTGPASPTAITIARRCIAPGDTAYSGIAVDTAYSGSDITVPGGAGSGIIDFEALILNGSSAGTFQFQWAQNTSDSTATVVKIGSYLEAISEPTITPYDYTNSGVVTLGMLNVFNSGGVDYVAMGNTGAIIHTTLYGSKIELKMLGGGGNVSVTIDGGTPTTVSPTASSGQVSYVTIFTGAEAAHDVKIVGTAAGAHGTMTKLAMFRVSSTAPACTRPSGEWYPFTCLNPTYSNYIALDGMTSTPTIDVFTCPVWKVGSGYGPRFNAATTRVGIWTYCNGQRIILTRAGVQVADVTLPNTGTWQAITLATGLNAAAADYRIQPISAQKLFYGPQILLDNGLTLSALSAKQTIVFSGDSIVAGFDPTVIADARLHDAYIAAEARGMAAIRFGYGGWSVSDTTALGGNAGLNTTIHADFSILPVAPAAVVLCGGTNDMFFGQTLSTFQTAYQTYISGVRTEAASAKIFCREILPNNRNGPTLTASYNAKIEAAFAAVGDGNAAYWNVDTWINADATDLIDNSVHPSVAGEAKIGAQEITKLIAAGF